MSPPDTVGVLEACEQALDLPAGEREAWLEAHYGQQPELVAAVRRLLARDAASGRLLPTDFVPPAPPPPDMPPPERVGVYRLIEPIGRGGMGAVYRAERDDGLFDHVVAVKIVAGRHFDRRAADRFAVERQALARLKHPNIARLLDGGVTLEGVPYLLMDYVEGVPIVEHIEAGDPSTSDVVGLVLQVCDAVADAHRKLVVHGDLKPSNILITLSGEARLLDFGVARLTDIADDGWAGPRGPMTAAYASPERQAGEPPTTGDDVYALGVLARELLTRAGPTLGDRATTRALPADLRAVLDKATAPSASRRYGSVAALANDLRRWLHSEPVAAYGGGWTYWAAKFARRRTALVAGVATAVTALAATAVISTVLYVQAEGARRDANRRFEDARSMAKYMLFGLYDQLEATPQSLAVRRDLADRGQAYLDQLSADSRAPITVRLEAVDGLARLASVQGGVTQANLGETDAARANLRRAGVLAADLARAHPDRADVWLSLARVRIGQASLAIQADNATAEAERLLAESAAAIERGRAGGDRVEAALLEIERQVAFAALRQWQSRYGEAIGSARRAIAALATLPAAERERLEAQMLAVRAHDVLAESIYYGGDPKAAAVAYRQAVAVAEALAARFPRDPRAIRRLVTERWALGSTLIELGAHQEALLVLERGEAVAQRLAAFDESDQDARRRLGIVRLAKSQALAASGRFAEGLALLAGEVESRRRRFAADPSKAEAVRDYAISLASLGDMQASAGRKAEACATYRRGLSMFEEIRRAGRLTSFDAANSLKQLQTSHAKTCGAA